MTACAVLGAALGLLFAWLQRPEPPRCTVASGGVQACMPA